MRTPYGPFVEALDRLVRVTEAEELRAALGAGGGELTRLLPDLPALVGELPEPVEADPDTERHRLHTAVADLLANVSRERPMLLVLEDGHWADAADASPAAAPGARRLAAPGCCSSSTFRDTEADRCRRALAETLADLRRSDDVVRMRLPGLSGAEVSDLVSRAAGDRGPDPELRELASTIHDLTGGNAFLVCELWRALVETGIVEVADGQVRRDPAAGRARHARKRPRGGQPAALAPGPEDHRPARARRRRRAGVRAGADPPRRRPCRARAARRPRGGGRQRNDRGAPLAAAGLPLHPRDRAAGPLRPALAAAPGGAPPPRRRGARGRRRRASDRALADLAHHFGAAAPFGGAERAIEYNLRAARAASAALAFDDAAMRLRTAIEIGIEDEPERAAALLELGSASHRAGKATDALEAFAAAAEIARGLGSAELLARAAIGYEEACWRPGVASRDAVELLEEALAAVGEESDELRIGLLAGLARALGFQGEPERGAIVRDNAVALARRLDDRRGAREGAGPLLLGARHDPAGGDPGDADRGEGPGGGAGRRRDPHRGDGLAGADLRRSLRPRGRAGGGRAPCGRWPSGRRSRS